MALIRTALSLLVIGSLWPSAPAVAQPLGTFLWQLQPYCNVLTLRVTQAGGVYTLDGTDDRCGGGQAASAQGLAFLNPNGTIGFGATMAQPGAVPVHLEATINVSTLSGAWRDSFGASGNFVLTPGAGGGWPRRQACHLARLPRFNLPTLPWVQQRSPEFDRHGPPSWTARSRSPIFSMSQGRDLRTSREQFLLTTHLRLRSAK